MTTCLLLNALRLENQTGFSAYLATMTTFTSACAAGCSSVINSTITSATVFSGCSCASSLSASLAPGFCPVDCSSGLYYFMLVNFLLTLIMTFGRVS